MTVILSVFRPCCISCSNSLMSRRVVALSFFISSCSLSNFAIMSPFNLITMLSCSSRIFICRSLAAIISDVFSKNVAGSALSCRTLSFTHLSESRDETVGNEICSFCVSLLSCRTLSLTQSSELRGETVGNEICSCCDSLFSEMFSGMFSSLPKICRKDSSIVFSASS